MGGVSVRAVFSRALRALVGGACCYGLLVGASCVPGRGPHLGKKRIERWIRKDPVNTKCILRWIYATFSNQ